MGTYKRRIVYLSDEEWDRIRKDAGLAKMTASAYIRGRVLEPFPVPPALPLTPGPAVYREWSVGPDGATVKDGQTPQQKRDAILRKVNRRSE